MNQPQASPPLIGFVATSGTGKTTLLEKIIPILKDNNCRPGLIKHAHHDFEIDYPGKDSFRLRKAGAHETMIGSRNRWALIHENNTYLTEPALFDLLSKMSLHELDVILVEGFKHEQYPKILLHREALQQDINQYIDQQTIAVASDIKPPITKNLPLLDINNPQQIAHFILQRIAAK